MYFRSRHHSDLNTHPARALSFGHVSVFHTVTAQGGKVFEAWQQADRDFLRKLLDKFHHLASLGLLKISALCTHPRGQGGVKRAVADVDAALRTGHYTHVFRSDAKSYYASIRHDILLAQLAILPLPGGLQKWVAAYCQRTLHYGGLYATSSRGISQGGSLSPLLGALYLTPLAMVYDRTAREARNAGKATNALPKLGQTPRPSQAELLRRVETYRTNWQRYLKGLLAGFHSQLGAVAAQDLFLRLCAQPRQLCSLNQWFDHFPLPRWAGNHNNNTNQT